MQAPRDRPSVHAHEPNHPSHSASAASISATLRQQQFDAGKLGMWLFLLTEILLFGGLFCAYAVYRANHPEIFLYAHQFLDKNLGAINTCVLILSSFTMAWGVRCAQRDRQRGLIVCLLLTLLCACGVPRRSSTSNTRPSGRTACSGPATSSPPQQAAEASSAEHAARTGHSRARPTCDQHAAQNVGMFFSIYFLMTGLHGHPRAGRHGGDRLDSGPGPARRFRQPLLQRRSTTWACIGTWSI